MKKIAQIVSFVALAVTIVPCLMYFAGSLGLRAVQMSALIGTAVWFLATPLWMGDDKIDEAEVDI